MRRVISSLIVILTALTSKPQSLTVDNDYLNWEATFSAGLNSNGWQFDLGMSYFPNSFIGMKISVGATGEIRQLGDIDMGYIFGDGFYVDPYYDYDSETHYVDRYRITPALVLRSPKIINWAQQGAGFYLFAEPGINISPGASGSRKAQIATWNLRTGINLQIDRLLLFAGYEISNFYLYSGIQRNPNPLTHSFFIGTSYKL